MEMDRRTGWYWIDYFLGQSRMVRAKKMAQKINGLQINRALQTI